MPLFKSKYVKELDALLADIKINLANNYKSTAHAAREKLGDRCETLYAEGKIKENEYRKYKSIYDEYTEMLKNYHH